MKTYLAFVLLTTVVSLPIAAQDNKQQDVDTYMQNKEMNMKKSDMMGHHDQKQMQLKQQEMSSLMQKIENETNPQQRQELMTQHMTKMRENMQMMGDSKGKGDDSAKMMALTMDERMKMMEGRMQMMQMMMDQMVSHSAQSEMHMQPAKK